MGVTRAYRTTSLKLVYYATVHARTVARIPPIFALLISTMMVAVINKQPVLVRYLQSLLTYNHSSNLSTTTWVEMVVSSRRIASI
jgi:hypothetical protein